MSHVATKMDIVKVETQISRIEAEIKLMKWMLGLIVAGVASLILKTFF